ncbi:Oxidation resistance protein [Echinococcus granulosus]|uniref:Oxidation resistance protein 1 n=1 Tax=Echinococcus granulosus TaxID=6210 RepID=W6UC08_ECHGR|nr:Oxidation resistance protein [Echinococcus granulosus]EUB58680.1 Oxidation resistance protein [Echinococcus granulosus]
MPLKAPNCFISVVIKPFNLVKPGDSLMSIAARVGNVTPAQLARFNRLGMFGTSHPPLFPGQRLYIPNKDEISAQNVRLRHLPGAATRVHYLSADISNRGGGIGDTSQRSCDICPTSATQDSVMERLFVKVKAKRVLLPSKSEIGGVLILTPDAVCFDAVATASALNRATAAKRHTLQHLSSVTSDDGGGDGEIGSSLAHSPPPEPVLEAAEPVHDVLALSVCIPIAAVVSLNTHGDMRNLLSGCRSKTSNKTSFPKDLPISTEIEIDLPDELSEKPKAPSFSSEKVQSVHQSTPTEECERVPLPEEVFISIGIDTGRISSADSATLCEAAASSLHVFKIPLDRLADIHDILVSATNSAASQLASSDLNRSRNSLPNLPSVTTQGSEYIGRIRRRLRQYTLSSRSKNLNQKLPSVSMIESALEEMEKNTVELNLMGGKSCILTEVMLKDLAKGLPPNRIGSAMRPIFSTAKDGFSLNTLYRKTKCVQDVNLLLILDQQGVAFGALLSEKMHCSQRFYGTGESCVFHWKDGFKVGQIIAVSTDEPPYRPILAGVKWENSTPVCLNNCDSTGVQRVFKRIFYVGRAYFMLVSEMVGHSAIWFDGDLKYGRSEATDTFDNPVLCSIPSDSNRRATGETNQVSAVSSNSSSVSLHDTCGPSSVAFVISALEVWEMIT